MNTIPDAPTLRDMNLAVFEHRKTPHVFFQPRFEPWYWWHQQFDSLPPVLHDTCDVREVYDRIGASIRTIGYYTPTDSPIVETFDDEVKIEIRPVDETHRLKVFITPHGELAEQQTFSVDRVWRHTQYAGRSTDDLPALKWLLQRRSLRFDPVIYQQGVDFVGERGVAQFWIPKSPYMALAQQWMNFDAFMYAMMDDEPGVVELMEIIDQSYDTMYQQLCEQRITPILNYGENLASAYFSPDYFERFMMPWYDKRVAQLRQAGIYSHIHIDGYFKPFISLIRDLPHDGLEALTPEPQGDVTLDEMREAVGDKVLLDGIPAVLFLDHHSDDDLRRCVDELIEKFPRLVLGISDELPQAATDVGYQRLKWVAEYVTAIRR